MFRHIVAASLMLASVSFLASETKAADECSGRSAEQYCLDRFQQSAKDLLNMNSSNSSSEDRVRVGGNALQDCYECAMATIESGTKAVQQDLDDANSSAASSNR